MNNSKWIVLGVYAAMVIAALINPGTLLARGIVWVFLALIVIHFIEFLVVQKVFKVVGGSMSTHFVQTMVFGFVHWKPLQREGDEA